MRSLLGACGLAVRCAYPDNTEIMPQVELRFHFDLYAGVRPARLIPGRAEVRSSAPIATVSTWS